MNTMLQTTITPRYINPPKGNARSWAIKDVNGEYWGFPENLRQYFNENQPVHVSYDDRVVNGRTFHNIKDVHAANGAPAPQQPAPQPQYTPPSAAPAQPPARAYAPPPAPALAPVQSNGNSYYRPTSPVDAERMFCCGALNAAIQGGQIQLDGAQITAFVNAMRQVWAATLGAQ